MRKFVVLAALLMVAPAMGQTWTEVGDAGADGIAAAQDTVGAGALTTIEGSLLTGGDEDVYGIQITDPDTFYASIVAADGGSAEFDSQLFLFDVAGFGVVHNDDYSGLDSKIDEMGVTAAGTYYLGISAFNSDPLDDADGAIFGFTTIPGSTQQRLPNPGAGALASWTGDPDDGAYVIALRGAAFIPEPASLLLLALGGLAIRRR